VFSVFFNNNGVCDHSKTKEQFDSAHWAVINHPLQLNIDELSNTIKALLKSAQAEDDYLKAQKELIQQSLLITKAKLYSSLRSTNYLVCMQNASIIRYHAEYLRLSSHTLNETEQFNKSYVAVFRQEMEEFRELFKVWVQEIKQMDKEELEDEWGLF
jgi:hypothetical protein